VKRFGCFVSVLFRFYFSCVGTVRQGDEPPSCGSHGAATSLNLRAASAADCCGDACVDFTENYLSLEPGGVGRHLTFLAAQGLLYFAVLLLLESHLLRRLGHQLRRRRPPPAVDFHGGLGLQAEVGNEPIFKRIRKFYTQEKHQILHLLMLNISCCFIRDWYGYG